MIIPGAGFHLFNYFLSRGVDGTHYGRFRERNQIISPSVFHSLFTLGALQHFWCPVINTYHIETNFKREMYRVIHKHNFESTTLTNNNFVKISNKGSSKMIENTLLHDIGNWSIARCNKKWNDKKLEEFPKEIKIKLYNNCFISANSTVFCRYY